MMFFFGDNDGNVDIAMAAVRGQRLLICGSVDAMRAPTESDTGASDACNSSGFAS